MKQVFVLVALLFSGLVHAQSQCGLNTLGGIDTFPWRLAQPFPWNKIQGIWKVSDDPSTVIKLRVTRENQKVKQLKAEVFSRDLDQCEAPVLNGVGIVTSSEKNVVRISLRDKAGSVKFMTIGMFNAEQLNLVGYNCEQDVFVASLVDIGDEAVDRMIYVKKPKVESNASYMMLKKITGSLEFYCKKRN